MNANTPEFEMARGTDRWVPACGGTETPFRSRSGVRLLYCFNHATAKHAYINVDTDTVLANEEAFALMGNKFGI